MEAAIVWPRVKLKIGRKLLKALARWWDELITEPKRPMDVQEKIDRTHWEYRAYMGVK